MQSGWVEYKGKRIFYVNYSGYGDDVQALKEEVEAAIEIIQQEPAGSVVTLSNVNGLKATTAGVAVLMNAFERTNPYVYRRAVIGLSGFRRSLIRVINRGTGSIPMKVFEDKESALEYLISD